MERAYTEGVRESFFSAMLDDTKTIWKTLDRSDKSLSSPQWAKYYEDIVDAYRFSSRFAVMRVLFELATGRTRATTDEASLKQGFFVDAIGSFPDITMEHAQRLTDAEQKQYEALLLLRAREKNPEQQALAKSLAGRMMALCPAGEETVSREELLLFGHLIDVSLEQMQFLLLRVLADNAAGFQYSASMDLIDMYGFFVRAPLCEVLALKSWYREHAAAIRKTGYEHKAAGFTQELAEALEDTFAGFRENRTKDMQQWLLRQAPMLDLKQKTARVVYVNLAAFVCGLCAMPGAVVPEIAAEDFYADMERISQLRDFDGETRRLLFCAGLPDEKKCALAAATLYYEYAEFAGGFRRHDRAVPWFVPQVEDGKAGAADKTGYHSRRRMQELLMDREKPKKSDILMLLWLAANLYWTGMPELAQSREIFMDDFLAAAARLLDAALLPEFYPPCVLEQTLLLSIALGTEERTPAEVYETLCRNLSQKGEAKKTAGATRKTAAQREEILAYFETYCKEHPEKTRTACKKDCAGQFHIGVRSLENYLKDREKTEKRAAAGMQRPQQEVRAWKTGSL